jgi:hypothetical protein
VVSSSIREDPIKSLRNACDRPDGDCAGRTHFIIHQTVDGTYTYDTIKSWIGVKKGKSHVVILKTGEAVHLWPFQRTDIFATKAEKGTKPNHGSLPFYPLLGKAINVEIDYEGGGEPNSAQYISLAALYIAACRTVGRVLIIVPHIEVDRGIPGGHSDPQNFDYNGFYELLGKLGLDLARIPRFDHDRYWGKPSYKIPFASDWFNWPPLLKGDPHAQPMVASVDADVSLAAVTTGSPGSRKTTVRKARPRKKAVPRPRSRKVSI